MIFRVGTRSGAGGSSPFVHGTRRILLAVLAMGAVGQAGCSSPRQQSLTGDASADLAPATNAGAGGSAAGGASALDAGVPADAPIDVAPGIGGAGGNAAGGGPATGGAGGNAAGGGPGVGGTGGNAAGGGPANGGANGTGKGGAGTGGVAGVSGAVGGGGAPGTGGAAGGAGGAPASVDKMANGAMCRSGVECQSGNCSTSSVTATSMCCASGQSNCGSCVSLQSDNANCGSCASACGANRTCQSSSCKCAGYAFPAACGGCGSWTFESNTTEGWVKDTNPNFPINGGGTNGVTNVLPSQSQVDQGSYALAVPILADGVSFDLASIAVPLCVTGNTVNLGGYTMSADVFLSGEEVPPPTFVFFDAWGLAGSDREPANGNISGGVWNHLQVTFSESVEADHIAINLNPAGNSWQGTMYVDNVQLTAP